MQSIDRTSFIVLYFRFIRCDRGADSDRCIAFPECKRGLVFFFRFGVRLDYGSPIPYDGWANLSRNGRCVRQFLMYTPKRCQFMEPQQVIRHNPDCPARGKIDRVNIGVHSHKRRRHICHGCNTTFTCTKGALF